jgi:hypothetical protein
VPEALKLYGLIRYNERVGKIMSKIRTYGPASGLICALAGVPFGSDAKRAIALERTPEMQLSSSSAGVPWGAAGTTPPARDPNIAVQEEFELARKSGTIEAIDLFILRHPDHPLAEKARRLLRGNDRSL